MRINWNKVREGYGVYCDGLRTDEVVVNADDDTDRLECYESGRTAEQWCDSCMGWAAICELAQAQMEAARASPAGPACGHSACSQHFIDTGCTECVEAEDVA